VAISSRALLPFCIASALVAQTAPAPLAVLKLIPDSASGVELTWRLAESSERFRKATAALGGKSELTNIEASAHVSPEDLAPGTVAEAYFPDLKPKPKAKKQEGEDAGPEAKAPSRKVLYIPVKNAKALGAKLKAKAAGAVQRYQWKVDEEVQVRYLAIRSGYALVAEDKAVLEMALKAGPSLEAELAPLGPWMLEHDVVVMATEKAVQRNLDELIQDGEGKSGQPGAPGAAIAGLFKDLAKKARASVHHAGFGLDLPKEGHLRIVGRAFFKPSSPLAADAAGLPSLPGHPLGAMPEGPYALAMGGQWPLSMGFFEKMATQYPGLEPKEQERMASLMAKVNDQVLRSSFTMRAPKGSEPFLQGITGVSELKDGKAWMEAMKQQQAWSQEHLKGLSTCQEGVLPELPSLTVSMDLGKLVGDKLPPAQVAMAGALLFGGNRMQISYALVDGHTAAYVFGDKDVLKAQVAEVQKRKALSATKGIQGADAMLPKDSRFVLYVDPRGVQQLVNAVMKAFTGKASELPEVAETLPLAAALSMDPGGIQVSGSARPESIEAAGKAFGAVTAMAQPKGEGGEEPGETEPDMDEELELEEGE
jgi:hypothetical protein